MFARALLLTVIAALSVARAADAADVSAPTTDAPEGAFQTVKYTAAPAEANDLRGDIVGTQILWSDTGAAIHAGVGCTSTGAHSAVCPVTISVASIDSIQVTLGDGGSSAVIGAAPGGVGGPWSVTGGAGDDHITMGANATAPEQEYGGAGDDVIVGGPGADTISGGPGADTLHGGAGDDVLKGEGFPSVTDQPPFASDLLDGGDGTDTVDYGVRTTPVTVDLDHPDAAGAPGEDDRLQSIENIRGPDVPSVLAGDDGPNEIAGRGRLYGRGGDDTLIASGVSGDIAYGGPGNDTLRDSVGVADLRCGTGVDTSFVTSFLQQASIIGKDCDQVLGGRFTVLRVRTSVKRLRATARSEVDKRVGTLCQGGLRLYGPHGIRYGSGAWRWSRHPSRKGDVASVVVPLTKAGTAVAKAHGTVLARIFAARYCTGPVHATAATWRLRLQP